MTTHKRTILVTGGLGFIGSNFIDMILNLGIITLDRIEIINLDAVTYAANPKNAKEFEDNPKYTFYKGRIEDTEFVKDICIKHDVEGIINFAAESHVDRSIEDFKPFLDTNVIGTLSLLTVAKDLKLKKFVQVSTDEVYGSLELDSNEKFTENYQISPNSPYSAAKAAADGFVRSFYHTYGVPTVITRCSNNYGPKQHTEKLIPLMINNALDGKKLPIYGDGSNVRDWIHVNDHCRAVWFAYEGGKNGEVYNIGSDNEWSNDELVRKIISLIDVKNCTIQYVKDRLGHDRRYAIDSSKAKEELGWEPNISFGEGLKSTIDWYISNKDT
jgi:dTDP-glucose 4,6-dehydratase